jgi:lysophospholipase L1-like esterase
MRNVAKNLLFPLLLLFVLASVQPAAAAPPANSGYAKAIAALGDSITQATNACCAYGDHPDQSWSTGSGRADGIKSIYERLLQRQPWLRDNYNNAVSGAKAADLPGQAAMAAGQGADYLTILVGANDLCTPSVDTMTSVKDFRAAVTKSLAVLDGMRPRPKIFVSSIPDLYQLWSVLHVTEEARAVWSAARICQSMLAESNTEDLRQQVVQREHEFNEVLATACDTYRNCTSDGNAVYDYAFAKDDISVLDYFHPGSQGQAKLASITWHAWQSR